MSTLNTEITHPDYIWTWKNSAQGRRQSIWLPYFQSITKSKQYKWHIEYNGGFVEIDLRKTDSILVYGSCGNLPIDFLDELNQNNICLMIHRRGMARPYIFCPYLGADQNDLLTAQILNRANTQKSTYIARTLIRERFHQQERIIKISESDFKKLAQARNVDAVRNLEAVIAKRYWAEYYQSLGLKNITRREDDHPVNQALDAGSFFLNGVLLRWILFHHLSPYHGYLHRPSAYTSLVFDLMEPYRNWIEQAVHEAYLSGENRHLTAATIERLKTKLDEIVYVPLTQQSVRRKSLLHGVVLSLRAWLLEEQTRFTVPVEGIKKGGRPVKVGFSMPGYNN